MGRRHIERRDHPPTIGEHVHGDGDCVGEGDGIAPCTNPWGPEGRSQQLEPIRNADLHPLGVTLSNGEFTLSVTDATISGRGQDLIFTRTYRSQSHESGWLGPNWSVALLNEKVIDEPFCDPDGLRWYQSDGSWRRYPSPSSVGEVVQGPVGRVRDDGAIEIRTPDGTVRRFGERHNGYYEGTLHLTRVTRPGAMPIELEWEPSMYPKGRPYIPVAMRLYSCDDHEATNPLGADVCDPVEVARVEFEVEEFCEYGWKCTLYGPVSRLASATVIDKRGNEEKRRRLEFS
jgi:hypothetical protein